jgi:outer membrane protein OmpA-like peptidoglycan-associated protein
MKNRIPLLLLLLSGAFAGNSLIAQNGDADAKDRDNIPPRLRNQQDEFDNGNYMFPAQKRSNWSVGVMLGSAFESSDVKATPGYGLGVNVQKALGHTFSLRGQATGGVMTGQNYEYTRGYFSGWVKNPWVYQQGLTPTTVGNTGTSADTIRTYFDYKNFKDPRRVYYNYRTTWFDASIQGVANLNNINFYKEQNKFGLYATAGAGFMGYHTLVDVLDKDGKIYNFDNVKGIPQTRPSFFKFPGVKSDAMKEQFAVRGVSGYFDNLKKSHYESWAENHADEQSLNFGTYKDARGVSQKRSLTINPFINASVGMVYRISRRIELGLEHRIAWTNDDLLDGQRWQENGVKRPFVTTFIPGQGGGIRTINIGNTAMTRDFDSYHFTAIVMNVRLGKGEESLWWSNPLSEMYGSVADTRKLVKQVSEDTDGDGIPDLFDQEPDTPEGELVDSKGRTLDSDEDGVPDTGDEQRFTPKGCDVDNRGVALDGDSDNVPDCFDQELNTTAGSYVDAKGRGIVMPKFDCKDCTKELEARIKELENRPIPQPQVIQGGVVQAACNLPSVHFDLDRTNVKQEFYPQLYQVARYMLDNPSTRIRVSGYTDRGGDAISRKRVENTINFLVGNFGVDRSRFETVFEGGGGVGVYTGSASGSGKAPQHASLDYMNRRVDFSCIQ